MGVFSVLKLKYRRWVGLQELNNQSISEELAVKMFTKLFSELSDRCIDYSWRSSGIAKFKNLSSERPEELNDDQVTNDLNERLEELELFDQNDF